MARKYMLRNQLHNVKKGNLTILVFLHNVKTIADSLEAIGEKVSDSDLVIYVLNGLDREFDTYIVVAQNKETSFTFAEIKPRLLNHKQWLIEQQHDSSITYDAQHPTAFYDRNGPSYSFNGNGRGKPRHNGNNESFKPSGSRNNGNGPYQGSTSYQGNGSYSSYHGNGSYQGSNLDRLMDFTTLNEDTTYSDPFTSTASHWISNSSATAHMTEDKHLLQNTFNYKGKDQVQVGNDELLKGPFQVLLKSSGINVIISCPKTPEQNGLAERKHRHITEMENTLLFNSSCPKEFWYDAFLTATYFIN
ncbi:uncharacterized protein LOC113306004 [Papaver somniferum]|uniref:uncharacterized protein LOC113306004 n=1 Tax=Papaver somniferum TaxID=3469 RepID=UPI000E6F96AC|nr:uncharacterized protein LOC113306004 [Papaver somniferum]